MARTRSVNRAPQARPLTVTALLVAALGARAEDCAFCEHTGCVHDLAAPLRLPRSPIAARVDPFGANATRGAGVVAFVHVNKAAGTTMKHLLANVAAANAWPPPLGAGTYDLFDAIARPHADAAAAAAPAPPPRKAAPPPTDAEAPPPPPRVLFGSLALGLCARARQPAARRG